MMLPALKTGSSIVRATYDSEIVARAARGAEQTDLYLHGRQNFEFLTLFPTFESPFVPLIISVLIMGYITIYMVFMITSKAATMCSNVVLTHWYLTIDMYLLFMVEEF
jgi:hypothetical protein